MWATGNYYNTYGFNKHFKVGPTQCASHDQQTHRETQALEWLLNANQVGTKELKIEEKIIKNK